MRQRLVVPVSGYRAEVRRDDGALLAVRERWDDLHARSPGATPFQSASWLAAWWRRYGTDGALRLVLVAEGDRLVAGAALFRQRRAGVPVLRPVGVGVSDWSDVLLDPDRPDAVTALLAALRAEPGWAAVDLPEVAPDAAVRRVAARWAGPCGVSAGSPCQHLAVAPFAEMVAALPGSVRADVRRAVRRADKAGLVERRVPAAEAAEGVGRLLDLHRRQWAARGGVTPEHRRPRFERHLADAVPDMVERGEAVLVEYTIGGSLVASSLLLVGPTVVGGYLYGAQPDLFRQVNVTAVMMRTAIGVAVERPGTMFSMLRGREDYKTGWRPVTTVNERLVLSRGVGAGSLYGGAVRARAGALDLLRRRAPGARVALLEARAALRNPRRLIARSRS